MAMFFTKRSGESGTGNDDAGSDRVVRATAAMLTSLSVGFFCAVTVISSQYPGYFDRLLLGRQDSIDPIETGATEKAEDSSVKGIPVPAVVRSNKLSPKDFQIIMVFDSEAHLASPGELWRVRVGSRVPGLGQILDIEPGKNGGTVKAEAATLTGVAASR